MTYHYLFAGTGASALSLVYRMANHKAFNDKKILLIDQAPKNLNDRTWCSWVAAPTVFDEIVYQKWDHILFQSPHFTQRLPIAPYWYQMIRGIDFYQFVLDKLAQKPNIEIRYEPIEQCFTQGSQGGVRLQNQTEIKAEWVFNSLPPLLRDPVKAPYYDVKQHFKGWIVQTPAPAFDLSTATFMDFDTPQYGAARFFYVLPLSSNRALVEYTLFSEQILPIAEYETALRDYLANRLHIDAYTIEEEEFGIIPMTDKPFPLRHSERVINIGTAGGATKPSSGYTFLYIQHQADKIIQQLLQTGSPFYQQTLWQKRFKVYDCMLLDVLVKQRAELRYIFALMFKKHPIERVFRFLDDTSSFGEELRIMASMPYLPFLSAIPQLFGKKL